jgi:FKBP-type peptidyl-prolyl cis-trans isomerase SlyD
MKEIISNKKFVELTYKVIDQKTGSILTGVEFPLGYVHGVSEDLSPAVIDELEGKAVGDRIEVPIDCNRVYGPRDESLVVIDYIENVPEEYRHIGTSIVMENDKGETKTFIVTRMDEKTLTIDGNNPLCGREVIFRLEVMSVRDATDEEIASGGKIATEPDTNPKLTIPL